jgi:SulP family sulfate permease
MELLRRFSRKTEILEASQGELWGSVFDLWFLVPVIGLMVGAERGGSAHALGRDFLYLGAVWLFSALLFRTPLPLQPLKIWAFLFLILRPTPFVVSLSATILGVLLFVAGRSGLVSRLEMSLGNGELAAVRRAVGFYVRAIGALSLGLLLLHSLSGFLPAGISQILARVGARPPGIFLSLLLLVLPQFPVTLINGVLSTVRERREGGVLSSEAASRLTGSRAARWLGLANMGAGLLGVLPFCHGSGGLWVYKRHGIRTLLPSLVSSVVLIALGCGILFLDLSLPGPAFFTFFLVGFLLVEFFLKRQEKRKKDSISEGSTETLSGDPLGFWILSGGMLSGAVALGGIPLALVFLLGMKTALAISCGTPNPGAVSCSGGNPGILKTLPGTEKGAGLADLSRQERPRTKMAGDSFPSSSSPRESEFHSSLPGTVLGKDCSSLSLTVALPGFFRRAREILDLFCLCTLLCLFFFFLSFPLLFFPSIESDTVLQKILFLPRLSPRAP